MSPLIIHNHKPRSGGFTLIELLTVISIIGLLSSIILASLNNARKKAQDATIISDLRGFMSEAELLRTDASGYSAVNNTDFAAATKTGITNADGTYNCFSASSVSNPALDGEINLRWACSATNSDKSKLWSVSSDSGRVVTWDNSYRINLSWDETTFPTAFTYCTDSGARLPNIEELYTARQVVNIFNNPDHGDASFVRQSFWSSVSYDSNNAWYVSTNIGNVLKTLKRFPSFYARCVR
jgi:prepilin-type N-terminal cleavage/methylation domain-containing protein